MADKIDPILRSFYGAHDALESALFSTHYGYRPSNSDLRNVVALAMGELALAARRLDDMEEEAKK